MNNLLDISAFKMGVPRAFPIHHFPPAVRTYAEKVAESIPCPVEFVSPSILAVAAVVIGGKRKFKVKENYTVAANLMMCIVGQPGSSKSPGMEAALKPLFRIQSKLLQQSLLLPDSEITGFTIVTTDATMEALIQLLGKTDKLLLYKDEFMSFLNSMNQYRAGDDVEKFLSMFSQINITVNRTNKGPIIVQKPTLTILGSIQDDVLQALAKLINNGLLDRILFAFPEHMMAAHSDVEVSDEIVNAYCDLIEKIYNHPNEEVSYPFNPEAREVYRNWHIEFCKLQNDPDLTPFIRPKLKKLGSYMLKFALILEVLNAASEGREVNEISITSVNGGIDLINYFGAQLYKVGENFTSNKLEKGVSSLLSWLKRQPHGMAEVRKILACRVAGVKNKDEAMEILEEMKARNLGKIYSAPGSVEGSMKKVSFQLHENIWKGGGAHEK